MGPLEDKDLSNNNKIGGDVPDGCTDEKYY